MKRVILISMAMLFRFTAMADDGSVAMPFMAQNLNPASAAMGGISIFNNPASSVMTEDTFHFQAGYGFWKPAEGKDAFIDSHCKIMDKAALRLEYAQREESGYDVIDELGETIGRFTPGSRRALLGASIRIGRHCSVGADAIYASRSLYEDANYKTLAANAALMVKYGAFNAVAGIRNAGIAVKDSRNHYSFNTPGSAFMDLGFNMVKGPHAVFFGGEFEYMLHNEFAWGAGASYTIHEMFSIRGGYHGGGLFPNHFSAGLGLKIKGVRLNATALLAEEIIDGSFLFGIGFGF